MTPPAPSPDRDSLRSMRFDAPPRSATWRAFKNRAFVALGIGATSLSIIALGVLLTAIVVQGYHRIWGIDHEAVAEAMAPQLPDDFTDLARVNWASFAATVEEPALAALEDVDWDELGVQQDLMYADEIELVDWPALAAAQHLDLAPALADFDWPAIYEGLRIDGQGWISAHWTESNLGTFVRNPPSRNPEEAGIGPALMGTVWICLVCALVALPLGVGTAIFLEEYRPRGPLARRVFGFIQLNISNLAGVPSIVYGIIGLTAFVQMFDVLGNANDPIYTLGTPEDWYYIQLPFGRGVLAGGLTLMLVILPIVIIAAQEAIRAVPDSLRQGSFALGATRWQMVRGMSLPAAIPGIMTGSILAMSRAIGEAAPILIICGIVFIRFTPGHVMDEFTALPLQIFDWAGRPQAPFHEVAASGILILLVVLLTFNAAAIFIRQKFHRQS